MKLSIKNLTLKNLKDGKLKNEIPEFYDLKNVVENNLWHNKQVTFDHVLEVFENFNKIIKSSPNNLKNYLNQKIGLNSKKDILSFCALFHDIAKPETVLKDGSSCPNHEEIGAKKIKKTLKKFDFSPEEQIIIVIIIKNHAIIHNILKPENKNQKKDFEKFKKRFKDLYIDLCLIAYADTLNGYLKQTKPDEYNSRINFYKNLMKEFKF